MKRIVQLDDDMDNALVEYAKRNNTTIATAIRLALKQMLESELGVELEAQLNWGGRREREKPETQQES